MPKKGANIIAYNPASFHSFPKIIGNKGFIKINIIRKIGIEIINNFFNVLLNVFNAFPVFCTSSVASLKKPEK